MNSTVKDVMSTHVIAVRQSAPYKEMAAMLHEQRVSAFPVLDDDNKVIGVVSEADLLTKEALEGTVPRTLLSLAGARAEAGERAHRGRPDDQAAGDHRPRRAGHPRGPPDVRQAGQAAPRHQRRRDADRHRDPLRRAERVQPAGCGDPAPDHQGPDPGDVPVRPRPVHRHRQGRHRHHRGHTGKPPTSAATSSAPSGTWRASSPYATGSATRRTDVGGRSRSVACLRRRGRRSGAYRRCFLRGGACWPGRWIWRGR